MGAQWADVLSIVCGIIYSFSWNISFYPQVWENYKLKSVAGFSLEYALLNPSGYLFYSIYCSSGFLDPTVGSGTVDWSDLFFATHGLALSTTCFVQCLMYSRGKDNKDFKLWVVLLLISEYIVFIVFLVLQLVKYQVPGNVNVINVCGYCKAMITLVKYSPQVYLNYKRKSTKGWSIANIFLDFCGGLFSLLQLVIEAVGNDKPIIGDGAFNVVKFALSWIAIVYNIIFFIQHYCIYGEKKQTQNEEKSDNQRSLSIDQQLTDGDDESKSRRLSAKYKQNGDKSGKPRQRQGGKINYSSKNESLVENDHQTTQTASMQLLIDRESSARIGSAR